MLRTSWGGSFLADPTRTIGDNIQSTGIYDIVVSETVARLAEAGSVVVDVGANVGYMTVLAATVVGPHGQVVSFEPHPELFEVLRRNIDLAGQHKKIARVETHRKAVGEARYVANLELPPQMATNDGVSRVTKLPTPGTSVVPVDVISLDEVIGERAVSLLKVDVEGFELPVMQGATRALEQGKIRHVLFEDHDIGRSALVPFLRSFSYEVFSLGWTMRGLQVAPVEAGSLAKRLDNGFEAPNFLATLDSKRALPRLRERGWRVLSSLGQIRQERA